jgi:hypothetical protein
MKAYFIYAILLTCVLAGCSSGPKHLPAGELQRQYQTGNMTSLEHYSYVGETNGAVYVRRERLPLLSGSRPRERILFTETNALSPSFLDQIRHEPKVEPAR